MSQQESAQTVAGPAGAFPLRGPGAALLGAFFVSGVAGLAFQILWSRQLGLVFGSSAEAIATVVAAFMGGFALGGLLLGRLASRLRRPLVAYAAMEVVIGVAGVGLTWLLPRLGPLSVALAEMVGDSHSLFLALRWLCVFSLLAVPAVLMGGTLPILTQVRTRAPGESGRSVAMLYAWNTAGAVVGCLLPDFVLVPAMGMQGTGLAAGACSLLAAGLALLAGRLAVSQQRVATASVAQPSGAATPAARAALLAIALSGMVAIGYEVFWARLNVFFAGSQVFGFSSLLAIYLLGIAAGSAMVAPRVDRSPDRLALLGTLELLVALVVVASLPVLASMGALRSWLEGALSSPEQQHSATYWFTIATSVNLLSTALYVLPATLLLGATVPVAARIVVDETGDPGRAIGRVYFWNTLAGIPGALGIGYLVLPALGSMRTLALLITVNAMLGLWLLARSGRVRGRRLAVQAGLFGVIAALLFVVMPRDYLVRSTFFQALAAEPGSRDSDVLELYDVLSIIEGASQTSAVVGTRFCHQSVEEILLTDSQRITGRSFKASRYMKLMAHVPVVLAVKPRSACLICFGLGTTLEGLAVHPELKTIDVVDIAPEVYAHYRAIVPAGNALDDPRVHTITDDGRTHLLTCGRRYDVITLEPPPPPNAGVVNLYSREFYEIARGCLTEGGVLCQWVPFHGGDPAEMRSLIKAFIVVFPDAMLWSGWRDDAFITGTAQPVRLDAGALAERLAEPRLAASLREIGMRDLPDLLGAYLMGPQELAAYCGDATAVVDDRPILPHSLHRWDHSPQVDGVIFARLADPFAHIDFPARWSAESRRELVRITGERRVFWRELDLQMLQPEVDTVSLWLVTQHERFAALLAADPKNAMTRAAMGFTPRHTAAARSELARNPQSPTALAYLGRLALYTGSDPAAARDQLKDAVRAGMGDAPGWLYLMALAEVQLGNTDTARRFLARAAEVSSDPRFDAAAAAQIAALSGR